MGGVWFPSVTNSNLEPLLWRAKFPCVPSCQCDLCSCCTPHRTPGCFSLAHPLCFPPRLWPIFNQILMAGNPIRIGHWHLLSEMMPISHLLHVTTHCTLCPKAEGKHGPLWHAAHVVHVVGGLGRQSAAPGKPLPTSVHTSLWLPT